VSLRYGAQKFVRNFSSKISRNPRHGTRWSALVNLAVDPLSARPISNTHLRVKPGGTRERSSSALELQNCAERSEVLDKTARNKLSQSSDLAAKIGPTKRIKKLRRLLASFHIGILAAICNVQPISASETISFVASGRTLHGVLFKPPALDRFRPFSTVLKHPRVRARRSGV
jgi:hypothetical protein